MKQRERKPDIILTHGKPTAVILNIAKYEELLERAEDAADLRTLRTMRRNPLRFRKLQEVLCEQRRV